jgi:hypothetical protein
VAKLSRSRRASLRGGQRKAIQKRALSGDDLAHSSICRAQGKARTSAKLGPEVAINSNPCLGTWQVSNPARPSSVTSRNRVMRELCGDAGREAFTGSVQAASRGQSLGRGAPVRSPGVSCATLNETSCASLSETPPPKKRGRYGRVSSSQSRALKRSSPQVLRTTTVSLLRMFSIARPRCFNSVS